MENPVMRRSVRSRFEPQATAGMRLEERDRELLADLFLHRIMSRSQLQELYFGSTVRCNARLRQLFDHGFVSRYYLPAAPFGAQALYSIGKSAAPIVASQLQMEIAEVRKQQRRNQTPTFIEHTLAIVDLRIAFQKAAVGSTFEIDHWLPEALCRHEYDIRTNQSRWINEVFKPDAFVRLVKRDTRRDHNYFIEVDLGHTSSRQFGGKLVNHQRYLESGLFHEVFGCEEFRTLVITTSEARLRNLSALAWAHDSHLFWFTTFDSIKDCGITENIWQGPLVDQQRHLLDLLSEQP